MKKFDNGIESSKDQLNWGENLERYLSGRVAVTITICNGAAIQSHK